MCDMMCHVMPFCCEFVMRVSCVMFHLCHVVCVAVVRVVTCVISFIVRMVVVGTRIVHIDILSFIEIHKIIVITEHTTKATQKQHRSNNNTKATYHNTCAAGAHVHGHTLSHCPSLRDVKHLVTCCFVCFPSFLFLFCSCVW